MGIDSGFGNNNFIISNNHNQVNDNDSFDVIDNAAPLDNSSDIYQALNTMIHNLNDPVNSIRASKAIADYYYRSLNKNVQKNIIQNILRAPASPLTESLLKQLLMDNREGSYTGDLSAEERELLHLLIREEPEERYQLLLQYIDPDDNPSGPLLVSHIREHYALRPEGYKELVDDDLHAHIEHLTALAKNSADTVKDILLEHLTQYPDYGRQLGKYVARNPEIAEVIGRELASIISDNKYSNNHVIVNNIISYTNQAGSNKILSYMEGGDPGIRGLLSGNTDKARTIIMEDNLFDAVERGQLSTLYTLGRSGPIAIPVLFNHVFK